MEKFIIYNAKDCKHKTKNSENAFMEFIYFNDIFFNFKYRLTNIYNNRIITYLIIE